MTKDEALVIALEAFGKASSIEQKDEAITAIKEALAQPEQEPVAYGMWDTQLGRGTRMMMVRLDKGQDGCTVPLYTTPSQRKPLNEEIEIMREMLEVQGQHGNWNYDSYMHGLYNGMEYMVALAERREPKFRDAPETWLAKYEVKRDNFNNTQPFCPATGIKGEA